MKKASGTANLPFLQIPLSLLFPVRGSRAWDVSQILQNRLMCCGSSLHPREGLTTVSRREEPSQAAAKSSALPRDGSLTAQVCTHFYWVRSWYLSPQEHFTLSKSSGECWRHLVHIYGGRTSHHPLAILSHLWTHRLVTCRRITSIPILLHFSLSTTVIQSHCRAHPISWPSHEPKTETSLDFLTVKLNSVLSKLLFHNEASRTTLYKIHCAFKQLGRGHSAALLRSQEEWEFSKSISYLTFGKEKTSIPAFCCTILSTLKKI